MPFTAVGSELLFEVFSQRYERGATLVTSNLPFDEWTSIFGSERLTGALLDRLTHHVHILESRVEDGRGGLGPMANTPFPITGSPEAVACLRFPQNVACGFPAPRSSTADLQHHESLQIPVGEMQFGSR